MLNLITFTVAERREILRFRMVIGEAVVIFPADLDYADLED